MDQDQQQQVFTTLAVLREQLQTVMERMEELKAGVSEMLTLDRTIAELSVRHEQQTRELSTQWARIDGLAKEQDVTTRTVDAWVNRGRGAWVMAVSLGTMAQALVLASVAWTFNHVRAAEDAVLLLNQRVQMLEAQQPRKVAP